MAKIRQNYEAVEDDDYDMPVLPPQVQREVSTFIYQLNPQDILEDLRHKLKNEVYDEQEKKWKSAGKPRLNEQGVNDIVDTVESVVNKNTFLSDVNEDQIMMVMRSLHIALAKLLFTNFEKYEIDQNHLDIVLLTPLFLIFPALKRAEGGNTLKALTQMHQIIEQIKKEAKKPKKKFGLFSGGGEE